MKETSSTYQRKLPEETRHLGRCFQIIDLGTQQGFFNGQPKEPAVELMFVWELPGCMHVFKEGEKAKPLTINQTYTYSSGDRAKLPKILKAWGKITEPIKKINPAFVKRYLGQYCMLDIEHNKSKKDGTIYANIGNNGLDVKPWDPKVPKLDPINPPMFFDLEEFSWDKFYLLPKNAQNLIRKSAEWPSIISKSPEPVQDNQQKVESFDKVDAEPEDDGSMPDF